VSNGATRRLVSFRDPERLPLATAFAWPRLAIVQTTQTALPDGQFTCANGAYAPPTPPTLVMLNAAHAAYQPTPAPPTRPAAKELIERCGEPAP